MNDHESEPPTPTDVAWHVSNVINVLTMIVVQGDAAPDQKSGAARQTEAGLSLDAAIDAFTAVGRFRERYDGDAMLRALEVSLPLLRAIADETSRREHARDWPSHVVVDAAHRALGHLTPRGVGREG